MPNEIYERRWLRPTQYRTAADRRFGDARALRDTQHNERANGTVYLAGFVIEMLLKALLMRRYPWLETARDPSRLTATEQRIWKLCYRDHDIEALANHLPEIVPGLEARGGRRLVVAFKSFIGQWKIHVRYSPFSETATYAATVLNNVAEIKKCLQAL